MLFPPSLDFRTSSRISEAWQLTGNFRCGSWSRADYAPPALDTRNFHQSRQASERRAEIRRLMLAVTNPTCFHITTFSDTAPTLLDPRFCKRNRGLPPRCKDGNWSTRRPYWQDNKTSGVASFGRGGRRGRNKPVRHASARPRGVPLAMMASALSRDLRSLRAARARFFLPGILYFRLELASLILPWNPVPRITVDVHEVPGPSYLQFCKSR